jgi:hypothetical protein
MAAVGSLSQWELFDELSTISSAIDGLGAEFLPPAHPSEAPMASSSAGSAAPAEVRRARMHHCLRLGHMVGVQLSADVEKQMRELRTTQERIMAQNIALLGEVEAMQRQVATLRDEKTSIVRQLRLLVEAREKRS